MFKQNAVKSNYHFLKTNLDNLTIDANKGTVLVILLNF